MLNSLKSTWNSLKESQKSVEATNNAFSKEIPGMVEARNAELKIYSLAHNKSPKRSLETVFIAI